MPKRGGRAGKSSAPAKNEDESHIVFGDAKSAKKKDKQKEQASDAGAKQGPDSSANAPPKPDTRTLIGGASWTGKLPVNMLSELCQKQKWSKPEYTMSHNADGFSSMVILKSKHPKTQEETALPPFKLPPDMKHLAVQPSAVEARHFAATYALFRVNSMKNIHMMLPPKFRDLWKNEFHTLKVADEKDGKGWMYAADPFAAKEEREQAQALKAKKRAEIEKQKAREAENPGLSFMASSTTSGSSSKGRARAPKVEMGKQIRADVEQLVRKHTVWHTKDSKLSASARRTIIEELVALGFRKSHAEEALEDCSDRSEALEWLLIYVPEDDLPKWAFPEGYTAGVSMASGNLKKDAMVKRLMQGGYAADVVAEAVESCNEDEGAAAETLQDSLVARPRDPSADGAMKQLSLENEQSPAIWDEEQATLEAIYASRYQKISDTVAEVELEAEHNGSKIRLQVRRSSKYPHKPPVLSVTAPPLPSYVKLSITQKAIFFAHKDHAGEPMVFALCDWLESNISSVIDDPGKLKSLSAATVGFINDQQPTRKSRNKPKSVSTVQAGSDLARASEHMFAQSQARMETPAQQKMLQARQNLPAWRMKDTLVNTVSRHQVTIIAGETGSGKSTQAVQFLLDDLISQRKGATANIICTQPRRISALGLADRVSAERCSTVGDEVGYAIRGEHKQSKNTRIAFVTTGVLLRRLQTSGTSHDDMVASLAKVSHVVVDEVHERSLDTDFLLALLKDLLSARQDLKLVLMSATLDADIFQRYFDDVGVIMIEGRTFPVQDYHLDQVIEYTGFQAQNTSNRDQMEISEDETSSSISRTIQTLGMGINYELIKALIQTIDIDFGSVVKGGVLVFMPGTLEIKRTIDTLQGLPNLHALPLHASLTPAEQRRVFPPAAPGKRKVIVATNVAETSITVEDIVAVIDTGKVKETSFDPQSNMVKLQEVWASKAACKQRRGRAGRVQEGTCYKLFTRNVESKMAERPEPEIKRVPLEQLCLSVRAMGVADVPSFLSNAITPPDSLAVQSAIKLLQRMGALDSDHELTALGQHLSMIPADLRCGKLIVYGAIFGCLESCLTIAAILTARNPFLSPQTKREESKAARGSFAPGQGDLICDLRAYEQWSERKQRLSYRALRSWCDDNFLSVQTLEDISSNRSQYLSTLNDIGFLNNSTQSQHQTSLNSQNANTALIRALIAGAFSPQIARIDYPDKKYAASVSGAIELDPEARTIKYFNEENGRVFIHPSSPLFSTPSYPPNTTFLSYFTKLETSKIFIRDLTPFNTYALLMFSGGKAELDVVGGRGGGRPGAGPGGGGLLLVDGWVRVRGWARIGVLVSRLRGMLDGVLRRRVEEPGSWGGEGEEVVGVVRRLLEFDGMDR